MSLRPSALILLIETPSSVIARPALFGGRSNLPFVPLPTNIRPFLPIETSLSVIAASASLFFLVETPRWGVSLFPILPPNRDNLGEHPYNIHMLPAKYIDQQIKYLPPDLRDIVLELRNIVASVAPDATEKPHSRGFNYYFKERGGPVSAGICQIGIFRDHIRLGFIHGSFLPDPDGLLVGEPKYKKHIRIYHYDDAPWDYVKQLIEASSRFDPYTLKEREK